MDNEIKQTEIVEFIKALIDKLVEGDAWRAKILSYLLYEKMGNKELIVTEKDLKKVEFSHLEIVIDRAENNLCIRLKSTKKENPNHH